MHLLNAIALCATLIGHQCSTSAFNLMRCNQICTTTRNKKWDEKKKNTFTQIIYYVNATNRSFRSHRLRRLGSQQIPKNRIHFLRSRARRVDKHLRGRGVAQSICSSVLSGDNMQIAIRYVYYTHTRFTRLTYFLYSLRPIDRISQVEREKTTTCVYT